MSNMPDFAVQCLVFASTTIGVLALASLATSRRRKADERFDQILDSLAKVAEKPKLGDQLLERASQTLSKPFQPRSEAELGWLKKDLVAAGFQSTTAIATYSTVRLLVLAGVGLTGAVISMAFQGPLRLIVLMVGLTCGLYLPRIVVRQIAKRRQKRILKALPDVLDLLVISIEGGQALDAALRKIIDRLSGRATDLASEFRSFLNQINMGIARREALHALGARSGVSELNSLAAVLSQADRFGSAISDSLRELSESVRIRRRHMAEELAQQTAVKLIFPLVLFIFPGIFAVLVGPAAISLYRDFMGAP